MKQVDRITIYTLLIMVLALQFITITRIQSIEYIVNDEIITAYTPKEIYYLQGKTLSFESGRSQIEFDSRNIAVQVLEEYTANDCTE